MDEAWNNKEDQKFALWFLFVPDFIVGYLYDDVVSFYDRAKDISKNIKTIKIKEFIIFLMLKMIKEKVQADIMKMKISLKKYK